MKKEFLNKPKVIGGVGDMWGKQFRNQYRVLDKKHVSYAINATALNGLYVKKLKMAKGTNVIGLIDKGYELLNRVYDKKKSAPTIRTFQGGGLQPKVIKKTKETTVDDFLYTAKDGEQYGIFKLSPRECGRLMGVRDEDITKMLAANSNSQCYKQFGNSIVVPVLMAIFSQLRIKGVPVWNELTEDEREKLVVSQTIGCGEDAEKRSLPQKGNG